jgi:hypothetical protein
VTEIWDRKSRGHRAIANWSSFPDIAFNRPIVSGLRWSSDTGMH